MPLSRLHAFQACSLSLSDKEPYQACRGIYSLRPGNGIKPEGNDWCAWRWARDSNPRGALAPHRLAGVHIRPLYQPTKQWLPIHHQVFEELVSSQQVSHAARRIRPQLFVVGTPSRTRTYNNLLRRQVPYSSLTMGALLFSRLFPRQSLCQILHRTP